MKEEQNKRVAGIDVSKAGTVALNEAVYEPTGRTRRANSLYRKGKPHLRLSYLGVPAPAGMSDCYESMSRTPIRDRLLQQPLIGHSRHPFANPAPQSSFRRRPESR